jgi:hypothetical protein
MKSGPVAGVGGLSSISQSDFLTRYERSWEEEEERRKRRRKEKREELLQLCDTRAFFLTPNKNRHASPAKPNIVSLCKLL